MSARGPSVENGNGRHVWVNKHKAWLSRSWPCWSWTRSRRRQGTGRSGPHCWRARSWSWFWTCGVHSWRWCPLWRWQEWCSPEQTSSKEITKSIIQVQQHSEPKIMPFGTSCEWMQSKQNSKQDIVYISKHHVITFPDWEWDHFSAWSWKKKKQSKIG